MGRPDPASRLRLLHPRSQRRLQRSRIVEDSRNRPLDALVLHADDDRGSLQAQRLPRGEFAARLLLGVRGDRGTAWRNPFGDLELGALLAYYEKGKQN